MSPVSNRKVGIASALTVAVAASSLTLFAVQSRGETVHEADLFDGGVWVSSAADASFARLNKAAGQFDAGVKANTTSDSPLDVVQDGSAVAGLSVASGQLVPIDPRTGRFDEASAVAVPGPAAATNLDIFVPRTADLRGGTVAMVDPQSGKVWAQRVDTRQGIAGLEGLSAAAKPIAQVGAVAALAVDIHGGVHAVSGATGKVVSLKATATGFEKPVSSTIDLSTKAVDITAVGDRWVVYNPARDEVFAEGLDKPVNGGVSVNDGGMAYAALQYPGPDTVDVALQAADQVHVVGLDGGPSQGGVAITEGSPAGGLPPMVSRPLRLGSCLHAAWAAPTKAFYNVNCGQEQAVPAVTIERVGAASLRDGVSLRTNRRLVVLNDLDGGEVWDLDSKPVKIDDWESLIPPPQNDDKNDKKDENLIDEASTAQPPKAEPDNLEARPGRTSQAPRARQRQRLDRRHPGHRARRMSPNPISRASPSAWPPTARASTSRSPATPAASPSRSGTRSTTARHRRSPRPRCTSGIAGEQENTPPHLRPGPATLANSVYPVNAGKLLPVQVIGDWRDRESDTVSVRGHLRGQLGRRPGPSQRPRPAQGRPAGGGVCRQRRPRADVRPGRACRSSSRRTSSARRDTKPDVVRGVVGKPLQIEPLGNDIAGADPSEPDAKMRLRPRGAPQVGPLVVDTDPRHRAWSPSPAGCRAPTS